LGLGGIHVITVPLKSSKSSLAQPHKTTNSPTLPRPAAADARKTDTAASMIRRVPPTQHLHPKSYRHFLEICRFPHARPARPTPVLPPTPAAPPPIASALAISSRPTAAAAADPATLCSWTHLGRAILWRSQDTTKRCMAVASSMSSRGNVNYVDDKDNRVLEFPVSSCFTREIRT
jgi:hypothetical protein